MNRSKKVLSVVASALIFSIAGPGQAQAADIAVTVGDGWASNLWSGAVGATLDDRYSLSNGSGVYVEVVDAFVVGDAFRVLNNGSELGVTSTPVDGTTGGDDYDAAWALNGYSWGVFALGSGPALVSFVTTLDCCGGGAAGVRFVSSPSKAVTNPINRSLNSLRLDAAGVTTEKNNVVSCTPGKYTFLNGSSTPETANIQGYVYTLLVNGKAVSTLSTDNFKSVASHQFPTIAGNMAGTATLDGATWDLKGMSNYSAECQVNAFQSNANAQSVTTAAHDSVALAAAAAEAAKAQMAKDMIAAWASDEAAAKKARNARLAGKP
jgi:hypothetical protein